MGRIELAELQKRKRDQIVRLVEVSDLTNQLLQAVERRDQVSVQVLLSMRQTPIQELQEIDQGIDEYLLTLPEEEAIRYKALLDGAAPEAPEEEPLGSQAAQFRRTLDTVIAADRRLSMKLGGNRSFYHKFRE